MPRTVTGPERAAIQAGHANVAVKFWVEDPDGSYVDVDASLDGSGWTVKVTLEENVDAFCMGMSATIVREASALQSLAPLREDSVFNVNGAMAYAPFLDVGRKWKVDVSVVQYGAAPSYTTIGEGLIDTVRVNHPENTIAIAGRDLGAALIDRFIESRKEAEDPGATPFRGRIYAPSGTDSMEVVIQQMLDDVLAGSASGQWTSDGVETDSNGYIGDGYLAHDAWDSAAAVAGNYVELDMGVVTQFDRAGIFARAAGSGDVYKVRGCNDGGGGGGSWVDVATGFTVAAAGWNYKTFTPTSYRFWRLQLTTAGGAGPKFGEAMLDDSTRKLTLYTPSSPGFTMIPWQQEPQSLLSAVDTVARAAGLVCRYRYDASDVLRLTLYEPDRGASVEDWTIGPDEYTALPTADIEIYGVRNKITVRYFNDSTKKLETKTAVDTTSIARYGGAHTIPRVLEVDVSRDTHVTTDTKAVSLADAILSDLKDPPFLQEVQVPNFWPVQLGDYIKFTANDVHYDTDQFGAVNHIRHEISGGQMMTTLQCGGQPKGHYTTWIADNVIIPRELAAPQGTVAIEADGAVRVAIDGPEWVSSYKYATSTSDFPTLATVRSSGTTANGRHVTVALGAATLLLGETIYVTAIPYALTQGKGLEGPSVQLTGTRHDFSAGKTVWMTASSLQPLNAFAASRYAVTSGYVGIANYNMGTDGGANVIFSQMLALPDGVTVTAFSANVYSESGKVCFVDARIDRVTDTGGFTTILEDTSANVGWETVTASGSEDTTGRKYRFIVGLLPNSFVTAPLNGELRIANWSYTYTMPSSDKAI